MNHRYRQTLLIYGLLLAVLPTLAPACADEDCSVCLEEKCPDLLGICRQDADCACMADCMGDKGIPGLDACLESCGLEARPVGFVPLEECVAGGCPDGDECSVPAGYVVPDDIVCDGPDIGIGGGSLADCGFDPALAFDPQGPVLQLESADQGVCVRIERRNDGSGGLANTKWTLLSIRVGPLGEVALADDPSAICWFSSHHNLLDWAHAWTGSRRHDVKLEGFPAGRTYKLYTFEQGPIDPQSCDPTVDRSNCIGDPVELFPR